MCAPKLGPLSLLPKVSLYVSKVKSAMRTRSDMNRWGVRREPIQVLKWGSPSESLAVLTPRQHHKHIRRMVLSLQGLDAEAAALE